MPAYPETVGLLLAALRNRGWSVAVHNDYRSSGTAYTFYLLTHENGRWVKGEATTDAEALAHCCRQIDRFSINGPVGPYAVRIEKNGWLSLGFDTHEQAERFWRWAEKELENARNRDVS